MAKLAFWCYSNAALAPMYSYPINNCYSVLYQMWKSVPLILNHPVSMYASDRQMLIYWSIRKIAEWWNDTNFDWISQGYFAMLYNWHHDV